MTKATTYPAYYTNETTEEVLRELNKPPFSEEQLSTFDPADAKKIREHQSDLLSQPVIGIRRMASEGSQSRLGGQVIKGTAGVKITLDDGNKVTIAAKGDPVQYPDGSIAFIVTGAGKANSDIALVGSRLDNGDEIINTPQGVALLAIRAGQHWADDFLPEEFEQ